MTVGLGGLILLRPWWLLALPVIVLAAVWMRRRALAGPWAGVIDPELLPALRRLGRFSDGRRDMQAMLPFIAAAMVALALSGPALPRAGAVEYRALDPMILIMDLSPSVVADELALTEAKAAAATLAERAAGRPVGMMVYAADAYLASAPTSDAGNLAGLIAVLAADTMPVAGSRPDIALSMARDLFGDSAGPGIGGADLVLISDGGGTGPRATEEAARLAHDGARIWALTLPRNAPGAPEPVPQQLAELARAGSGAAFPSDQPDALLAQIESRRSARLARELSPGRSFHDLGPWLLPVAMLALLPLFRRRR